MRRMKRRRRPRSDIITAAWISGRTPPPEASGEYDLLVGLIYFAEHPPKRWPGKHHPHQREWLDALAEAARFSAGPRTAVQDVQRSRAGEGRNGG